MKSLIRNGQFALWFYTTVGFIIVFLLLRLILSAGHSPFRRIMAAWAGCPETRVFVPRPQDATRPVGSATLNDILTEPLGRFGKTGDTRIEF